MSHMPVTAPVASIISGLIVALAALAGCSSSSGGSSSACEGAACSGTTEPDGGGPADAMSGADASAAPCGTVSGPISGKLLCKVFRWEGETAPDGGLALSQMTFGVVTADGAWSLTGAIQLPGELAATTYTPSNANSSCSFIPSSSGNVEGGWMQTSTPPSDTTPTDHLGTFTLTITSVGMILGGNGLSFDTTTHGTLTMTLVDTRMKQGDEQVSVTF